MTERKILKAESLNIMISLYHKDMMNVADVASLLSLIASINDNASENEGTVLFSVGGEVKEMNGHKMIGKFVQYIEGKLVGMIEESKK